MRNFILVATLLVPAQSYAGGYLIPNETARDLGLSESALANQQGAEAGIINPSALAGQEGLDVSANGELLINRSDWSDPALGSASTIPQTTTPPAAAISYGMKLPDDRAWGAGVAFDVPAGGALFWPNSWPGQESIRTVDQRVYEIAFAAAFQPVPYLKIGASYNRYQATEELHQGINYLDHFGDAGISMSGGANGFGLSAQFTVPDPRVPLAVAIAFHHTGDLDISGHAHFTDVPPAFQTMLHDQDVTETLKLPEKLFLGAAYEVMPNLKVMAAYDLERWSVYKNDTFVGSSGLMITVPRNYNNAHVVRAGAEWQKTPFLPELTLRAGMLIDFSDQPSDTVSPTLSDGDKLGLSIGGGYDVIPGLRVDVGYQHVFYGDVKADGPENLQGTYKSAADLISIGVNWRTDLAFLSR